MGKIKRKHKRASNLIIVANLIIRFVPSKLKPTNFQRISLFAFDFYVLPFQESSYFHERERVNNLFKIHFQRNFIFPWELEIILSS